MPQSLAQDLNTASLFEKLGGAAGIRRIVDGTVAAHMCNPVIKARFLPYEDQPDRVEEIKRHTCDFFAAGSGGPDRYHGRSMAEAHRDMDITPEEYEAAAGDIMTTMEALSYDPEVRDEVHAILQTLKDEIIHK